jgi:hypothetical protein
VTSFRQIEANRRNALRSSGPTTQVGKDRSRRNAIRHGLSAETVIPAVEDIDDYRAFEAAVIVDYDATTAVERELSLRLASLLWRLRRATSIETALLGAQADIVRHSNRQHRYGILAESLCGQGQQQTADQSDDTVSGQRTSSQTDAGQLALSFQRLANFDNGAFDRLGRYEARLWRQTLQTLLSLHSARCP